MLAINADRLYLSRTGQDLIEYRGPHSWVEEQDQQAGLDATVLRQWATELLAALPELDLGGPRGDDYIIDEELVALLHESIDALVATVDGAGLVTAPLVVDIERIFRAGASWF